MISGKAQSWHVELFRRYWEINWISFQEMQRELNYMSFDLLRMLFIGLKLTLSSTLFDLLPLLNVIIRVTAKYFSENKSIILCSIRYNLPGQL